jgi:hypothetical protein
LWVSWGRVGLWVDWALDLRLEGWGEDWFFSVSWFTEILHTTSFVGFSKYFMYYTLGSSETF